MRQKFLQPNNEYLMTIKLQQITAKHNLIANVHQLREFIIDELAKRHWNYNLKICSTFEMMKKRVLNIPQTTKELLELGKFVHQSLQILLFLLQLCENAKSY